MHRFALVLLLAPAWLAAEQQVLLVLLKGANALGYYSIEGKHLGSVNVGEHPHEMVLSPDEKFAFITDNGTMRIENPGKGGNTVSVVGLALRKRVDTISTGRYRRPHGIALDRKSGLLTVTAEAPDRLIVMDWRQRRALRNFETKGKTSHMVTFGPDVRGGAEYAYVSNSGMNTVSAIQLTTGAIKTILTGDRPEGSVLSPDGRELYVANRESNSITVIDTGRQAAIGEIKTGKGPVRVDVTPDGRTLVYACLHENAIEWADLELRRPTNRLRVDGQPVSLNISKDGKWAFASVEEKDAVYVIDVPGKALVRKFQTAKGSAPDPVMMVTLP